MSEISLHEGSWWFLLLIPPAVALIWYRWARKSQHGQVRFSSTSVVRAMQPTWAVRARVILPILRTLAVVLLIVALTRPRKGNEQTRISAEGIAIQLLVDRSGSMQALDFKLEGQRVNRLEIVKHVVREFVLGDDDQIEGRPDDLIGTVVFAGYADSQTPLTLDHQFLVESLETTRIADTQDENGTAIGDAVALGVERLRAVEEQRRIRGAQKIKSKVIVLLTDGVQEGGIMEPIQAAEIAAAYDIKIYSIGAGTKGYAPVPVRVDPRTGQVYTRNVQVQIDEDTLKEVSAMTGGKYFRATDTDSLREIYRQINELEKTRTEERRYLQYTELATAGVKIGSIRLPPILPAVFALLVLEMILSQTRFRKMP